MGTTMVGNNCVLIKWRYIIMLLALLCREKGIKYRKDEAIGGWFSQIGIMHQVHHMWGECLTTEFLFSNIMLDCSLQGSP